MLTKEHLKFRVRSGRVKPELLTPSDPPALAHAAELLEVFRGAVGLSLGELENQAGAASEGHVGAAFTKLLLDACDVDEEVGDAVERRWQWMAAAQRLRSEGAPSLAAFQDAVARAANRPFGGVRDAMYGDLPSCRRVRGIKDLTAEELIARYNLAQVQGLLLRARRVTLRLQGLEVGARRELFRQIKFRRLIALVTEDGSKGLVVELSGPLGLLDQASAYGLRLATFFPSLVHLAHWDLRAEVLINNRELELRVDHSAGLSSHYHHRTPYIPDELTAFVETFNEREAGRWRAEPGGDFVHIGRESYCFPDLTIHGRERRVHVELFHKWHAAQLGQRLESLEKYPVSDLLVGVGKGLADNPEVARRLAVSTWFGNNGFIFSEFPTPKTIAARLEAGVDERKRSKGPVVS